MGMDPVLMLGAKEVILRLLAATLVGAVLGLNRELKGKPAGLRTLAMVTLGAALATLVCVHAAEGTPRLDPTAVSHVIQGIITGVGFLGAGVIMRNESGRRVEGLTTAATIWISACLGIVCGVGFWGPVLISVVLVLVVLIFGGPFEQFVNRLLGVQKNTEHTEHTVPTE